MTDEARTRDAVRRMWDAATAFLASLDAAQVKSASAPFDVADHRKWTYLPGPRPGLPLAEMTPAQRGLALELLDAGCSAEGARTARGVIGLERVRRQLTGKAVESGDDPYWVRILGDVSRDEPWAWRVNGHHLAVHVTVAVDRLAVTPSFFGAEPAVVPRGQHVGLRTLASEEDLARTLLAGLDPEQRHAAITSAVAPHDIRTRFDPIADPRALPKGLPHAQMTDEQRTLLRQLVRRYFDRAPLEHANACWQRAVEAGLEEIRFGWAGSDRRGLGHYYCVSGPTFLIEYDNTQHNANHIHSVWRDLRNDWGEDLLAHHYADRHRRPGTASS